MALESPVQPPIHTHHQQQSQQPQQQRSSLIDNTLAQLCNRKRRLSCVVSAPSLLNCTDNNNNTMDSSSSSSSTPLLKMTKSDSTITDKLRMQSNTTTSALPLSLSLPSLPTPSAPNQNQFTHRSSNGSNVVMIVSGFPSSLSMESSTNYSSTTTSSQHSQSSSSSNDIIVNDSLHQDMSPDTLIKSILMNHVSHCSGSVGVDHEDDDHHHQHQQEEDQEVVDAIDNVPSHPIKEKSHSMIIPRTTLPLVFQPLHETDFHHPTEEQIAAYNTHIIAAVRASDIYALRTMHNNGQTLGCCNRYGESILHMACRRSNAYVVSFLLKEANVSPRIKDDHGRTPLHDACWRGTPEYSIVKLLLSVEPRLAFAKDVWGHTPFQYARKEHWGEWNEFLDSNRDLILS
ncbi:hypothetical protein ACHAWU_005617 [Discostella pseudostelligera]|uniref:Uncharacterized protein n=1 Tax=Discostella pseudostelligera TaxID=259834 RepID=A0ABD3LZU7_9STRA